MCWSAMRKEDSKNGLNECGVKRERDMDEAELTLLCVVSCVMEDRFDGDV